MEARCLNTLKSLLKEKSLLSKQGGILMKNNKANRAVLREQGKHFQRHIRKNRAKSWTTNREWTAKCSLKFLTLKL